MIYLDNSSTTHKKPLKVKLNSLKGLSNLSVNPTRGGYKLAIKGSTEVFKCREKLASFLGTTPENVIFTSGCTEALNLAIQGTVKQKGHIITTIYEHNSVLRVLNNLKKTHNISYTILKPNKNGIINTKDIENSIKSNTYMVIINHTSNVTGTTQNVKNIGKVCKKHNLIFLVDGAQSVGHESINMTEYNINLLTIAGHKGLYSPQGIGALLINSTTVKPIKFGGTGTYSNKIEQPTDYPEGLESGTQNLPGILGLSAGIEFVLKNQDKINNKIYKLTKYLITELNKIKYVKTYGSNPHSGVVSIKIDNIDSSEVSTILSEKYNIYTRSGLHCAPLVHNYFDTTKNGLTRISLSYFNKLSEIKKLITAITNIAIEKNSF
ncbi:MAG: aminotransferase class V-fold PLP-dependent enzyme [Clostridiales bacterium]|nr:aminotransferase class V-fold PLP-dependent enzyme [Clostridiales bacterium]